MMYLPNASFLLLLASLLAASPRLYADQKEIVVKKEDTKSKNDENSAKITINYKDDNIPAGEESYSSGIDRLFESSALTNGIAAGSTAINQQIETIMELIFYRILDRDLSYDITDESSFTFKTRRDLFPTPNGGYVVVDRFGLGPEFSKVLRKVNGVPISLGIDGKVNVFDIYLRTDGARIAEQQEMPFWRVALNNWLGVLPILSLIMPPSFNPNELYDPINLIETPFSFPLTVGGFNTMPVGSIRSYNITGGVSLPIDFSGAFPKKIRDALQKADHLKAPLPYSVFVEGEYRINVLRRDEDVAWVGLTTVKRGGHKISLGLANVFKVLERMVPWWGGVALPFIPIDADFKKSKAQIFNQLYEFNMKRHDAREAYRLAVKGDFTAAYQAHRARVDQKKDTGVEFHFTRNEDAWEGENHSSPNLILVTNNRIDKRSESEIEVMDQQGKFYVLESKQESRDEFAEVLTGKRQVRVNNRVDMKVLKIFKDSTSKDYRYEFLKNDPNPFQLTLTENIQDRFVDSHEYREYIDALRYFTLLKLDDTPKIPRRQQSILAERRKEVALVDPTKDQMFLHVTPTHLGRFSAAALVHMSAAVFNKILKKSENQQWAAFAEVFGLSQSYWGRKENRESFEAKSRWLLAAAGWPLHLLNLPVPKMDFLPTARSAIAALKEIDAAQAPMDKLRAFYHLFDSRYPDKITRALLLLADLDKVPRSVSFYTNAKSSVPKEIKGPYERLNNRVVRTQLDPPPQERGRISAEELNAFFPDELRDRRTRPNIVKIDVSTKPIPPEYLLRLQSQPDLIQQFGPEMLSHDHVYVRLHIKNMNPARPAKIYIRCDQAGKLKVGKFVLNEQVATILPMTFENDRDAPKLGELSYEFFLTGPLSPLNGTFFNNAIEYGGEFEVGLTASNNGQSWSDQRNFKFKFERGVLLPP